MRGASPMPDTLRATFRFAFRPAPLLPQKATLKALRMPPMIIRTPWESSFYRFAGVHWNVIPARSGLRCHNTRQANTASKARFICWLLRTAHC